MTTTTRANRRSPGTMRPPASSLVDALVSDAHRVLGHLPEQELGPKAAEAVALLALIAGQDVEPVEGSDGTDGRWRIAQNVAPDRVISTVDPDARHAHKTVHRRQDGFKAHIAVEPDTGIITDCALTKASGADNHEAAVGVALLAGEDQPVHGAGDSAYGTGESPRRTRRGRPCRSGQTRTRCARRCRVGSPSTTSPSTTPPARRRARHGLTRTISRSRIVTFGAALPRLPIAGPMHHQPHAAKPSRSAPTTRCNAPPASRAQTRTGRTNTANTGRWWNAPSPG